MSLQIINDQPEMFNAVIKVIGVGGGGGNAVPGAGPGLAASARRLADPGAQQPYGV